MGLIIYVNLLLLTPEILSLPFDPQDNAFLSWAHSYAAFHNRSNCWVCGALPSSSVEGFLWWASPLQGKDFLQVCEYLQQQRSYVMPLLNLMTSNNPKMDWCNTLYFNYEHDITFNFDYTFSWLNDYFEIWDKVIWLTPGSAERSSLHQWKASLGGHLHFKEKTFSKSVNTFNNSHMRCLFFIW